MESDDVFETIQAALAMVLSVDPASIERTTDLRDDLAVDSLAMVEVVMEVEDRLGLSVPEERLRGIVTVKDAIDLVAEVRGAQVA